MVKLTVMLSVAMLCALVFAGRTVPPPSGWTEFRPAPQQPAPPRHARPSPPSDDGARDRKIRLQAAEIRNLEWKVGELLKQIDKLESEAATRPSTQP